MRSISTSAQVTRVRALQATSRLSALSPQDLRSGGRRPDSVTSTIHAKSFNSNMLVTFVVNARASLRIPVARRN